MGRIESYEEYMSSSYAFFKYLYEINQNGSVKNKEIILEKDYIKGAKIAFLANIMTGIKEDIVSKDNGYSSKVVLEKLENTVESVAVKTSNGYELGGYHFDSAAEVVAIIRNKLAHGKYSLDLKNDLIIFDIENNDVEVSITKLSHFIVNAIKNYLKDQDGNEIERHISYINLENVNNTIKTESQIRGLLGRCHTKSFVLKSKDGSQIKKSAKTIFEQMINLYKYKGEEALDLDEYKTAQSFLINNGYEISITSKTIGERRLKKMVPIIKKEIFDNDLIDFKQKMSLFLRMLEKNNKIYSNKFSNMLSSFNNLILIDAIENTKSIDDNKLNDYYWSHYNEMSIYSFDELISSIIAMFNPSFQYLFDEIYTKPGEYSVDRKDYLDFSNLDISLLDDKNMFYTISDKPYLDDLLNQLSNLDKGIDKLYKKLEFQNENLNKINISKQDSSRAVKAIKESILKTKTAYQSAIQNRVLLKNHIDFVTNDLNSEYYKNRAIIEGIRNCISHGNFEVKLNETDLWSSKITFKDIYEGKETFSLDVSVENFMNFILTNIKVPTLFVMEKLDSKNKTY